MAAPTNMRGIQPHRSNADTLIFCVCPTIETRWDDPNLAYFSGYAMWNCLNTPLIFTLPGVRSEEIEPWEEQGEQRRRFKVSLPDYVATHCAEQVFYLNGFDHEARLQHVGGRRAFQPRSACEQGKRRDQDPSSGIPKKLETHRGDSYLG